MQHALEVTGLCKRFGKRQAVQDLNLQIPPGAVFGLVGNNGAGKTTALRLILRLTRPDAGQVRLFGRDLWRSGPDVLRDIGAMIESPFHYEHLSGRENLAITARLLRLPKSEIERVLDLADLRAAANEPTGRYSLGMKQRLGIARALLGSPRLLVLDEPANGLDPAGVLALRELLRRLARELGVTMVISSHLLDELERTVDCIGFMHHGRLLAQGDIRQWSGALSESLQFEVDDAERAAGVLHGWDARVEVLAADRVILSDQSFSREQCAEAAARLIASGVRLYAMNLSRPSLASVFESVVADYESIDQREAA